jgi:hypothetical protein
MSDPNVNMIPLKREDLWVELRGFEPLTPSMRSKLDMSVPV